MCNINEQLTVRSLIVPQSIAANGNVSGTYVDLQGRKRLLTVVHLGAVAADKTVKIEVLTAEDSAGTGAKPVHEQVYTAPSGGVDGAIVEAAMLVTPFLGRYLTVKVTNNGTAAVLASAELVADHNAHPEKLLEDTTQGAANDAPAVLGELAVTSIAGANSGDTKLTVSPDKGATSVYKYKVAASAANVTAGQNVSSWSVWDGTSDITAETGKVITVVEASADYKALKVGTATVTAKA